MFYTDIVGNVFTQLLNNIIIIFGAPYILPTDFHISL